MRRGRRRPPRAAAPVGSSSGSAPAPVSSTLASQSKTNLVLSEALVKRFFSASGRPGSAS